MQTVALLSLLAAAGPSLVAAAATTTFPDAAGESTLSEAMTVTGEFDGGLVRFGRGMSCDNDDDGGSDLAVFLVEDGGTVKNVIIGADQFEGIHCLGSCTIENVWWEDVCEDALTFDGDGTGTVIGGGAKGADDKVIQHNGIGDVTITDFYVDDFGKLYRSCGNCKGNSGPRKVTIDGVVATGGKVLAGVNSNYGDVATIQNTCGVDPDGMCQIYTGCDKSEGSCEAEKLSTGFDGTSCIDGGSNSESC